MSQDRFTLYMNLYSFLFKQPGRSHLFWVCHHVRSLTFLGFIATLQFQQIQRKMQGAHRNSTRFPDASGTNHWDTPPAPGHLSPELENFLHMYQLSKIKELLVVHEITTLHGLEVMDQNMKSVLLYKCRRFYDLLGIFPTHVAHALNTIFGVVDEPRGAHILSSGDEWGEPLNSFTTDTKCRRSLKEAVMNLVWNGTADWQHVHESIQLFKISDELAEASAYKAAEAYAILQKSIDARPSIKKQRDLHEEVKQSIRVVRNVMLWRVIGQSLGMDSMESIDAAVKRICTQTDGVAVDTLSQFTNAYWKLVKDVHDHHRKRRVGVTDKTTMTDNECLASKEAKDEAHPMEFDSSDFVVPESSGVSQPPLLACLPELETTRLTTPSGAMPLDDIKQMIKQMTHTLGYLQKSVDQLSYVESSPQSGANIIHPSQSSASSSWPARTGQSLLNNEEMITELLSYNGPSLIAFVDAACNSDS